jgi:putative endonuclease
MLYYNYILYSRSFDLYYKGITENIVRRLSEHNSGKGRYSDGKGPWELVYLKSIATKRDALFEERRIKKFNRRSLELMISSIDNEINKVNFGDISVF